LDSFAVLTGIAKEYVPHELVSCLLCQFWGTVKLYANFLNNGL